MNSEPLGCTVGHRSQLSPASLTLHLFLPMTTWDAELHPLPVSVRNLVTLSTCDLGYALMSIWKIIRRGSHYIRYHILSFILTHLSLFPLCSLSYSISKKLQILLILQLLEYLWYLSLLLLIKVFLSSKYRLILWGILENKISLCYYNCAHSSFRRE